MLIACSFESSAANHHVVQRITTQWTEITWSAVTRFRVTRCGNKNKHGARSMAGMVYVLGKDRNEVYKCELSFNFSVENFDTVFYHWTMRMWGSLFRATSSVKQHRNEKNFTRFCCQPIQSCYFHLTYTLKGTAVIQVMNTIKSSAKIWIWKRRHATWRDTL